MGYQLILKIKKRPRIDTKIYEVINTSKAIIEQEGYVRLGRVMGKAGLDQNDKPLLKTISFMLTSSTEYLREPKTHEGEIMDFDIIKNPHYRFERRQRAATIIAIIISTLSLLVSAVKLLMKD